MKLRTVPSIGRLGTAIYYLSPFGQCARQLVAPANPRTPARQHMRGAFARYARAWGRVLTQAQRDRWNQALPKVQSAKRLTSGPLTGQQLFQGLHSARACIGKDTLMLEPPAQVVFGPPPTGLLTITNGPEGVRLLLSVTGPLTEDIMVLGQAPCSAGRSKRRNVAYLGLLSAPQGGVTDITGQYVARYGEPRPGEKVFIVTVQQKDGYEGLEEVTSAIVPEPPAGQPAPATAPVTLTAYMYKGCTSDAQGTGGLPGPDQGAGRTIEMPVGGAAKAALAGSEGAGGGGGGPG